MVDGSGVEATSVVPKAAGSFEKLLMGGTGAPGMFGAPAPPDGGGPESWLMDGNGGADSFDKNPAGAAGVHPESTGVQAAAPAIRSGAEPGNSS